MCIQPIDLLVRDCLRFMCPVDAESPPDLATLSQALIDQRWVVVLP